MLGIAFARRANATIAAECHRLTDGSLLINARPSVTAIGPFRLKFSNKNIPKVKLVEIISSGAGTRDGNSLGERDAFPRDMHGKEQFVSPGETLRSTVVFRPGTPSADLIGWRVELKVASRGFLRGGLHWGDSVFVPLPPPAA